jgi:hypothetical protein
VKETKNKIVKETKQNKTKLWNWLAKSRNWGGRE